MLVGLRMRTDMLLSVPSMIPARSSRHNLSSATPGCEPISLGCWGLHLWMGWMTVVRFGTACWIGTHELLLDDAFRLAARAAAWDSGCQVRRIGLA